MNTRRHFSCRSLQRLGALGALLGWATVTVTMSGCMALKDAFPSAGPVYTPSNIYRGVEKLPASLKRVAVLPLRVEGKDHATELARPGLENALRSEIARLGRFELVVVRPEQLRDWTGRLAWGSEEALPPGFLEKVRVETGCDAILFSQLTGFRAYPPLAVGWRLRLIDPDGARVWWAADEWFDAGEAAVANAARKHYMDRAPRPLALADPQQILYSPLRFGTYTASALAATCPKR